MSENEILLLQMIHRLNNMVLFLGIFLIFTMIGFIFLLNRYKNLLNHSIIEMLTLIRESNEGTLTVLGNSVDGILSLIDRNNEINFEFDKIITENLLKVLNEKGYSIEKGLKK